MFNIDTNIYIYISIYLMSISNFLLYLISISNIKFYLHKYAHLYDICDMCYLFLEHMDSFIQMFICAHMCTYICILVC